MNNISVIGLGKLGSSMAAAYASKGHKVIGVDLNQAYVDAVNKAQAPVLETDLQKYITENKERLSASTDYKTAISQSDITFIIVPTPSQEDGVFSVKFAQSAAKEIGEALKGKNSFHLVVLTSTVLPQDCQTQIIPLIEQHSGKKLDKDFGFCYSPEFIALGSVIRDLLNPDFFLIGESEKNSGDILEAFYKTINSAAPVKRMSISSAELTKISLNHFLTMKITYANMLGEVAENIPGANIEDIVGAIGQDKRIGSKYLKSGLGFGGPCFPRDNRAFAAMAQNRGIKVPYAQATDSYNNSIVPRMLAKIKKYANPESKIAIIGLSYKPSTAFAEESQAVAIANKLSETGNKVNVFEPEGYFYAKPLLASGVVLTQNLAECLKDCDIIFLSNPGNRLEDLKANLGNSKKVIIDPWGQFKVSDFDANINYVPLGRG